MPDTTVVHAAYKDGSKHIVDIKNFRVLIVPDGGKWFAQGLEIDYAAQGESVAKTKQNFERGLKATISSHLKMYGGIQNLLKKASPDVCREILLDSVGTLQSFSDATYYEIKAGPQADLSIQYLVAAATHA